MAEQTATLSPLVAPGRASDRSAALTLLSLLIDEIVAGANAQELGDGRAAHLNLASAAARIDALIELAATMPDPGSFDAAHAQTFMIDLQRKLVVADAIAHVALTHDCLRLGEALARAWRTAFDTSGTSTTASTSRATSGAGNVIAMSGRRGIAVTVTGVGAVRADSADPARIDGAS